MINNIIYKNSLYNAIINGAKAVINQERYLNEINVFPVKDADTGSNMTSLMKSILARSKIEETLKDTLESISNAALIGSKGNSGIIFSQFIYGFTKDIKDEYIDDINLVKQLEKGYNHAYKAIDKPVEGTMITLMRSLYEILSIKKHTYNSFEDYLIKTNEALKTELNLTTNQLQILKKYNVVDAGALAFVIFIDGFINSVINKEEVKIENNNNEIINNYDDLHNHDEINYRYCTEVLIETKLSNEDLKSKINKFGDSLVVGSNEQFTKIHIHTSKPSLLIEEVSKYAKIVTTKVDDMMNQYNISKNKNNDICILTDSIADISKSIIDEMGIQVFPISINVDGTIYYDKTTIKNNQLLKLILKSETFPKTSSPNTLTVIEVLEYLKKYFKKIIVITVSSKMSSTYNVFKNAKAYLKTEKIEIIDSKLNSVSQGLLVLDAAKQIEQKVSFEDLVNNINRTINDTNILVRVKSLDNMVKGGRISKGLGRVGKLINLNPIVSIDNEGTGIVSSKVIGKKNSFNKIIKEFKKTYKKHGIRSYAITHVNNVKEAEKLKVALIKITNHKPEYVTEASSVIALNAGDGAVAVGFIKGVRK